MVNQKAIHFYRSMENKSYETWQQTDPGTCRKFIQGGASSVLTHVNFLPRSFTANIQSLIFSTFQSGFFAHNSDFTFMLQSNTLSIGQWPHDDTPYKCSGSKVYQTRAVLRYFYMLTSKGKHKVHGSVVKLNQECVG